MVVVLVLIILYKWCSVGCVGDYTLSVGNCVLQVVCCVCSVCGVCYL